MNWGAVRIWAAVLLLLDAAFGLWNHNRFQQWAPKFNVVRMAWIEAGAAFLLLLLHGWLRAR